MTLRDLFKKDDKRQQLEEEVRNGCIEFIKNYTDINGVRETSRRLDDIGFTISYATISEMRNGSRKYDAHSMQEVVRAINKLNEKK